MWCFDIGTAVATEIAIAEIVGQDEDYVRPFSFDGGG